MFYRECLLKRRYIKEKKEVQDKVYNKFLTISEELKTECNDLISKLEKIVLEFKKWNDSTQETFLNTFRNKIIKLKIKDNNFYEKFNHYTEEDKYIE
jgi:hypothetical protein